MRAILVCVDYSDILKLTLPYNRHHFEEVTVVTSLSDEKSAKIAVENGCTVYRTDSFYADGADFNKFRALEEGIEHISREGVIVVMDADIVWPKDLKGWVPEFGMLHTPERRMCQRVPDKIPNEADWKSFFLSQENEEFAGYCQIFYANDPVLRSIPWYQTNWRHAGGPDTFFHRRWLDNKKQRPTFECLHIGIPFANWCGRSTPYADGSLPEKSKERTDKLRNYIASRKGKKGENRYEDERL